MVGNGNEQLRKKTSAGVSGRSNPTRALYIFPNQERKLRRTSFWGALLFLGPETLLTKLKGLPNPFNQGYAILVEPSISHLRNAFNLKLQIGEGNILPIYHYSGA